MSSITSSALNADTLSSLSDFWLHGWKHGPLTEPMDTSFMQRWYQGSKEQDNTCKERYHEALIEAEQASHEHLLELATAKNDPYHAVGLLLLLDQISRNVYRGPEAKQVSGSIRRSSPLCTHLWDLGLQHLRSKSSKADKSFNLRAFEL